MTLLTSNGYQIGMVDVDKGSTGIVIFDNKDGFFVSWYSPDDFTGGAPLPDHSGYLPPGSWSILGPGLATQCSEEDAALILNGNWCEDDDCFYYPDETKRWLVDYCPPDWTLSALASLHSMIRANGKEPGKCVVIYKPLK